MGLFDRKAKKHRVPDLSRYSQYQPQQNSDRDSIVSAGAAASALRSHSLTAASYNPHNEHYNNYQKQRQSQYMPQRTMSMSSQRANSLSALNGRGVYQRSNSLTSNSSRLSQQPEKIIIRTTKTKDQYGRTTSITTETIRKLGSYELVKKETKDVSFVPPPAVHHGGYQGSLLDNELGSILEEEDDDVDGSLNSSVNFTRKQGKLPQDQYEDRLRPPSINERNKSPVRSILKNGEKKSISREKRVTVLGEDEEVSDGGSVYSDALDILPKNQKVRKRVSLDNVKVSENTGFAAKVKQIDRSSASPRLSQASELNQGPSSSSATTTSSKPQLTEEELYEMAYQVAMKKVYGDKSESIPQEPKKGGFKTYSLRGENPLKNSNKSKASPRLPSSRTSSLTSMTKPPLLQQLPQTPSQESSIPSTPIENPTHSPDMEPTPRFSTEKTSVDSPFSQFSSSPVGLGLQESHVVETPQITPQHIQPPQLSNPVARTSQDIPQKSLPPPEKATRRKKSLSSFFSHPSMRYQNQDLANADVPIFKRHSMRDGNKTTNQGDMTKNYNYQLNNKFTPEGPLNDSPVQVQQQVPHTTSGVPMIVQTNAGDLSTDTGSVVVGKKEKPKKKFSFGGLFKKKNKAVQV